MRSMKLAALAGVAALAMGGVPALAQARQAAQGQNEQRAGPPPTLALTGNVRGVRSDATTGLHLAIEVLDLQVRIRGGIAETRMTATFRNTTDQVLEGDFAFDMPAGSVVTGYALDVGGDLVDGVIAGRDQAREAYQRRVAIRVDPGLAEVTWADRFTTRIFPIAARGARTIRLVMTSPLDPVSGYVLPLRPDGPVGRLTIRIDSDDGQAPRATMPDGIAGDWQGGRFAVDKWNVAMGGTLSLMPGPRAAPLLVSRHANGERFFDLDVATPAGTVTPVRRVHIFWDRSASRADDDLSGEAALITAWLARSGASIGSLTLFDSGAREVLHPADAAALTRALGDVHYGGATSFAGISAEGIAPGDRCLLVSDGRATIDSRAGFDLPCRIDAIASDREVDRGWLGNLTASHGGALVELGSMTREAALAALSADAGANLRVTDSQGRAIETVRLSAAPGSTRLIGPMPDSGGLRLVAGDGSVRDLAEPAGSAATFSGPGAIWASRRIAALSSDIGTAELVALARRYSVASPLASFIVLEAPSDYVEANIAPPDSYPKALRDQYLAMRAAADQSLAAQQAGRLSQVVSIWDEQKAWWARTYAPGQSNWPTPVDAQGRNQRPGRRTDAPGAVDAIPPPPPPPPPPPAPPPPAPPSAASSPESQIVVTGRRIRPPDMEVATPVTVASADAISGQAAAASDTPQPPTDALQPPTAAPPTPAITLPSWSSSSAWMTPIEAAGADWQAEVDRQRATYGALPAFWFDVGEWHWTHGRAAEARRAVESALDLPARDNQTLAIVAARLERYGDLDRAIVLGRQLADRETERPQPGRTLALMLMHRAANRQAAGNRDGARADLREAIALLADAVLTVRREQPRGFATVALMDANLAVQRYRALGGRDHALPQALVAMLDSDLRVVVDWNTPRTDLDLWTTEPGGERVGYSHPLSSRGGKLSGDVTNGYGPEEYLIHHAVQGTYQVELNTYSADRNNPNGQSGAVVRIYRDWGRPDQREELIDVTMDPDQTGMRHVGDVRIDRTTTPGRR